MFWLSCYISNSGSYWCSSIEAVSIWPHLCSVYVDALWPALNPVVIITSAVFGTGISCQLYLLHGARRWENHPIGELTCPGLEVKFYYFTIYFTIPHGSALLVPCWRADLIYFSFMWPLLIPNVLRSRSNQIYVSLFIHKEAGNSCFFPPELSAIISDTWIWSCVCN